MIDLLVLTSWDDGHPSDLRLADLLARHGLAGTFFVPGENREGRPVLQRSDLCKLDQGFEIGSHTLSHRYLTKGMPRELMVSEIVEGKRVIEDQLGHAVAGFCYPGGRFDVAVVRAVKAAKFEYARTIENFRLGLGCDRWAIPTTLQFFPHSCMVLARNTLRYPSLSKLPLLVSRAQEEDFVTFAMGIAERCAQSGGVFHLWGHSWEIDQYDLWQVLDGLLGGLAGLSPQSLTVAEATSRCKETVWTI